MRGLLLVEEVNLCLPLCDITVEMDNFMRSILRVLSVVFVEGMICVKRMLHICLSLGRIC